MSRKKKSYQDQTYNAKNLLRRFSHRTRFKKSVQHIKLKDGLKVLDFGCGNGQFLSQIKESRNDLSIKLVGFEPYMESLSGNSISIYKEWDEILLIAKNKGKFDVVTSFEVFEHFNARRQEEAILKICSVVAEGGEIILSVPIEKGVPAVVKNIIRRISSPHVKGVYNFKNIKKSLMMKPIPEFRNSDEYLSHMGFYFNDLEAIIKKYCTIEKREFSPFQHLPYNFNSQVFYTLKIK